MALFSGLDSAYGTGEGRWIHEPPKRAQFSEHLAGRGPGLGIAPLRYDGTCSFAAIDLDEPDFGTAQELRDLLPGPAFIERSRSGNAHIFAFFAEPIDAWVARGIMREATAAVGKRHVEVFPKQDKLREGMVGSYINLPYHGNDRPVLAFDQGGTIELSLSDFIGLAEASLNTPAEWKKRARWLGVPSPEEREASGHSEFGTQRTLHRCAEYVVANRDENPVVEGHRAVVYFALSKMFANCEQYSSDESLTILKMVNESSPDPISEYELKRIYENAERGQFTSTSCDDPLFQPYADPECPIANGSRY